MDSRSIPRRKPHIRRKLSLPQSWFCLFSSPFAAAAKAQQSTDNPLGPYWNSSEKSRTTKQGKRLQYLGHCNHSSIKVERVKIAPINSPSRYRVFWWAFSWRSKKVMTIPRVLPLACPPQNSGATPAQHKSRTVNVKDKRWEEMLSWNGLSVYVYNLMLVYTPSLCSRDKWLPVVLRQGS